MKNKNYYSIICLLFLVIGTISCEMEEKPPVANFIARPEKEDHSKVKFINTSVNYSSVIWDFGDGSPTSSEVSPIHQYHPGIDGRAYTVTLTILGRNGVSIHNSSEIKVDAVIPTSIQGGDMDADAKDKWYVFEYDKNAGILEFGHNGALKVTHGKLGVNTMIYQPIKVEEGTYKFSATIAASGLVHTWIEAYVRDTRPGTKDPGLTGMLVGWSTWCKGVSSINGDLAILECNGNASASRKRGIIQFNESKTIWLGIKVGTIDGVWPRGIVIDDVKFEKQ